MKKIEKFLNSGLYVAIVFLLVYLSWMFFKITPPSNFNLFNIIGIFFFAVLMFLILAFFENTLYAAPIMLTFLFIISKGDMDFSTTTQGWIYIVLGLLILGPVVHYIRFRPKIVVGKFAIGLVLIALAYLLSAIHTPFDVEIIPVSIMGLIYLFFYVFLTSGTKGNVKYIFYILLALNFLFVAQLGTHIFRGFLYNPHLPLAERLLIGWGRNLGWGNVNDLSFYIALTLPANVYFIIKNPKRYWFLWFVPVFGLIAVFLSQSRGGILSFTLSVIGSAILIFVKARRRVVIQLLIALGIVAIMFYVFRDVFYAWFNELLRTMDGDLNSFMTNRITLYETGWRLFKKFPVFGAGWLSLDNEFPGQRMFMYHSTIVQSLAAMGIFGAISLVFHYYQVVVFFFRRISLEKWLFIIGYLASQIHGLVDNVQFALPYSMIMVVVFSTWEKSPIESEFTLINKRYYHLEPQLLESA